LKEGRDATVEVAKLLKNTVASEIGKIAVPDKVKATLSLLTMKIILTHHLPKTRSGKIMRRLLRNIALGKTDPKDLGTSPCILS
jgi:acetyl-CoA synthetase